MDIFSKPVSKLHNTFARLWDGIHSHRQLKLTFFQCNGCVSLKSFPSNSSYFRALTTVRTYIRICTTEPLQDPG